MDCKDYFKNANFLNCVSTNRTGGEFDVYFRLISITNEDKNFFGIKCNKLDTVSNFVRFPETFLCAHIIKSLRPPPDFISNPPYFKDGKSLCIHCKKYVNKLRGVCWESKCIPELEYI
jgi:hypothetical protein